MAGGYEVSNAASSVDVWHCQSSQSDACLNNDKNEVTLDASWQRVNNCIIQHVFFCDCFFLLICVLSFSLGFIYIYIGKKIIR